MPHFYERIVELLYVVCLGFGGTSMGQHLTAGNRTFVAGQAEQAAGAIHGLRVLRRDLIPRNILWNEENEQVMAIDFLRAEIEQRVAFTTSRHLISPVTDSSGEEGTGAIKYTSNEKLAGMATRRLECQSSIPYGLKYNF